MPKKGLIVFYRSRRSLKGYIVTSYRICFFSFGLLCGVSVVFRAMGLGFQVRVV